MYLLSEADGEYRICWYENGELEIAKIKWSSNGVAYGILIMNGYEYFFRARPETLSDWFKRIKQDTSWVLFEGLGVFPTNQEEKARNLIIESLGAWLHD